jgi:phage-related protein
MEFTVEFYETNAGRRPVEEFLVKLKTSDPNDFVAVMLVSRNCATGSIIANLFEVVGDGLFELRHVGKLNTRVLWFFRKGRRIVAVHGIRNNALAIPDRDLDTPRERMRDWKERDE